VDHDNNPDTAKKKIEGSFNTQSLTEGGTLIEGEFGATISYDKTKDKYYIAIAKHPLDLKYGLLILFLVEKIVLPQAFKVDSIESLLYKLIGGEVTDPASSFYGQQCIEAPNVQETCCQSFAYKAEEKVSGTGAIINAACKSLIPLAKDYLVKTLTDLDVGTVTDEGCEGSGFCIGTKAEAPCVVRDSYESVEDWKMDYFGDKDQDCQWEAKFHISNTDVIFNATFAGCRQGLQCE
jgi:hypothetical protein